MTSLAEMYLPFVAGVQFLLAGTILWLGKASFRAIASAAMLVLNALQGLALLTYNLQVRLERPTGAEAIQLATGVDAFRWVLITELLIAVAVGILAFGLVRNLRRRWIPITLIPVGLGAFAYLQWVVQGDPGAPGPGLAFIRVIPFVFAISLVLVCMVALPHVLAIEEGETKTIVLGSASWASPEHLMGKPTPASDVYQLGLVLRPYASGKVTQWVEMALHPDASKRPKLGPSVPKPEASG